MTKEQIQTLLDEARVAYHELQVGGRPVEVRDSNGESIRYSAANASRLWAYIKSLEDQLKLLCGVRPASRRAMRPQWG